MARRLGCENILWLKDNISDSKIGLKYRMPTTEEIVSYRNGGTRRVKNALVSCVGENRIRHGKKILTGICDDSFEKQVGDDWVPLSSDPKSKRFDPDWKKQVTAQAVDLIELLAVHVFDASSQVDSSPPDGEDGAGESDSPD